MLESTEIQNYNINIPLPLMVYDQNVVEEVILTQMIVWFQVVCLCISICCKFQLKYCQKLLLVPNSCASKLQNDILYVD